MKREKKRGREIEEGEEDTFSFFFSTFFNLSTSTSKHSFGGGSPHDAAKGIAIVASNGGDIRDYEGVDKMTAEMTPLIAVS